MGDNEFRTRIFPNKTIEKEKSGDTDSFNPGLHGNTTKKSVLDASNLTMKDTSKLIQIPELNYMDRLRNTRRALEGVSQQ